MIYEPKWKFSVEREWTGDGIVISNRSIFLNSGNKNGITPMNIAKSWNLGSNGIFDYGGESYANTLDHDWSFVNFESSSSSKFSKRQPKIEKFIKRSNPEYTNIQKPGRSKSGLKIRPIGVIKPNVVKTGSNRKFTSVMRTNDVWNLIAPLKWEENSN